MWNNILNDSYAHYFASSSMNTITEPKVIYINKYQWGIALLVLLCSDDDEVKSFIKEMWGSEIPLNQIKVEATIDNNALTHYNDHNAQLLARTLQANPLYVNAIKILNFGLVGASNLIRCRRLYYLLYALSMPVANGGAIRMQKAITSINIETDSGLKLADLSEGHKKRILVMLMTRILGDERTMYLLDEPDAHVDVMAKNKIVSIIETAKGYTILTTHSPLMTSVMKPEAVQTVNEGNVVEEEWASVVNHLSANRITTIDNFLFSFNKKVIITEGP
jgi:ABC-type cobalamin/Fe3+-siderophores transport system ATPase subunit